MNTPEILIADDDRSIRLMLETSLSLNGFRVASARGGRESLEMLQSKQFAAFVCDVIMPDLNGLDVLREVRQINPTIPVILITAQGSIDLTVEALSNGATDFLAKPFDISALVSLLRRYITSGAATETSMSDALVDNLSHSGLVGRSSAMVEVYKLIAQAARTNATVLITGESGTGKELVAKAIHQYSNRSEKNFIAVNCSGLTDSLLESELFGYTKGSFTGATSDKQGLFEAANGGTLFLDELASTTPTFQAGLLRVLQSGEVRRIGSSQSRRVDVRVIGASNASLREMADAGEFRADLFYRLSVIGITLPPLRERNSDIDLLALHFLRRLSGDIQPPLRLSQAAGSTLRSYPFPGNVRELENALTHAAALASNRLITVECLPKHLTDRNDEQQTDDITNINDITADWPTMEELERRYLQLALEHYNGNRSRTAEALGLDRRTVQRMLAKFNKQDLSM